jgi:hypothetical protein
MPSLILVTAKERISGAKPRSSIARASKSPCDPKEVERKRLSAAFGVGFGISMGCPQGVVGADFGSYVSLAFSSSYFLTHPLAPHSLRISRALLRFSWAFDRSPFRL